MRKNLISKLKRNLKPKERVLLLVHNIVKKETEGKAILTEAEEHALSAGWTPANNEELKEYKRYSEGWRLTGFAELDAQTTFLSAINNILRAERLIDVLFILHTLAEDKSKRCNLRIIDFYKRLKFEEIVSDEEALQLIVRNSGLKLDEVICAYAFDSLSDDLKEDILTLHPEARTNSLYLDQEEIIADLLFKDREKLADLIVNTLYRGHPQEWLFDGCFAGLPEIEILKKWANYYENYTKKKLKELEKKGSEAVEELIQKLKDYADKNKREIRDLLKDTLLRWLDEGLFVKEHKPIFNSDTKKTRANLTTQRPHKEIFQEWLKAKNKAKETIQGLIDKGELKAEERTLEFGDTKETLKIITGESLYNLRGEYAFAEDFRTRVDVFKGLGYLVLFLRKCSFLKDYGALLAFKEIFQRLSKVYKIDLTYRIDAWIRDFKERIEDLNKELIITIKRAVNREHNIVFLKENFLEDTLINLEEIKPSEESELLNKYYQTFKRVFGNEFK